MTRPRVQDHPRYPFRPGEADEIRAVAAGFLDAPPAGSPEAGLLAAFVALGRRFAFLERLIQGEVLCDLPLHPDMVRERGQDSMELEGERLAQQERDLLDWDTGVTDELAPILDGIGIKVLTSMSVQSEQGEDTGKAEDPLIGAFSFDEDVGPALLVGRSLDRPEAAFVLAHEFGHLVADVDPYRSRFCRWDPSSLENLSDSPEEVRADRFARALLMPAGPFRSVGAELVKSHGASTGFGPEMVQQMSAIFEVPECLVRMRLSDLGMKGLALGSGGSLGGPTQAGPAGESNPSGEFIEKGQSAGAKASSEPSGASGAGRAPAGRDEESTVLDEESTGRGEPVSIECLALPERYVNLSLAAFSETILDRKTLAEFLDTTESQAMRIVSWANLPG